MNRVVVKVNTRATKIDHANSVLLNFTKITESDITPVGEKKIFRVNPKDEEDLIELQESDELEEILLSAREENLTDEELELRDSKLIVEQSFNII